MRTRSWVLGLALLPTWAHGVRAQTLVSDDEAIAHRSAYTAPVLPPGFAGTPGVVLVKVSIGKDGTVLRATAVKGPLPLRAAAIAAVQHWHYRSFDEGAVVATVPVDFQEKVPPAWLEEDDAVQRRYFPAQDACLAALRGGKAEAALPPCQQALALAKTYPDESYRHLEIMDAYEFAGRALIAAQRPAEAEAELDHAADLARRYMKPTDAEYAYAFFWRAAARQAQGRIHPRLRTTTQARRACGSQLRTCRPWQSRTGIRCAPCCSGTQRSYAGSMTSPRQGRWSMKPKPWATIQRLRLTCNPRRTGREFA